MRCRPRKLIQATIVIACLVFYVNFFLADQASRHDWNTYHQRHYSHIETRENGNPHAEHGKDTYVRYKYRNSTKRPLVAGPHYDQLIYPSELFHDQDRILNQLKFIPKGVDSSAKPNQSLPLKTIYLHGGIGGWAIERDQKTFLDQKCAVPHCVISDRRSDMTTADVVLITGPGRIPPTRHKNQIWLLYLLESPYHTPNMKRINDQVNWTATYRHDSTIVAPYEKFVPYNQSVITKHQPKNYAEGKTKMVAWFVSNCGARNKRMQYATELSRHIEVDIYGRCGPHKCPRHNNKKCFDMLNKDYRFYLSFENSNCRDYITEKFFVNGLKHDVIPIVMGAAPEDYRRAAPPHSFIHVDDFSSPQELAQYLMKLANDDKLYNEYFQWKGTGDIINTFFWCRVCALAHDVNNRGVTWYDNIEEWWRGQNICIGDQSWRDVSNRNKMIALLPRTGDR